MDLGTVQTLPIRTILSGPVGGVSGSLRVAEEAGITHFVTCDMDGTSTDVCLIEDGSPTSVNETAFVGYPIKGRQIDINTVGAGGGSIAYADGADTLRVGPRSAGAVPGPACYGLGGTQPTITDANMVLGRIGTRRLGRRSSPIRRRHGTLSAVWRDNWGSRAPCGWRTASSASRSPRWPAPSARSPSSAAATRPISRSSRSAAQAPCMPPCWPRRSACTRS